MAIFDNPLTKLLFVKERKIDKALKAAVYSRFCLLSSNTPSTVSSYADEFVLNKFTFLFVLDVSEMDERKIKYPEFVDVENIKVENYGYDDEKLRFLLKVPFITDGKNYLRVIMKKTSVANEDFEGIKAIANDECRLAKKDKDFRILGLSSKHQ